MEEKKVCLADVENERPFGIDNQKNRGIGKCQCCDLMYIELDKGCGIIVAAEEGKERGNQLDTRGAK